jgi:hypothetical protein
MSRWICALSSSRPLNFISGRRKPCEAHFQVLSVQIAAPVEEVDFERRVGIFSDGGPAAEIGDGRKPCVVDARLHGINAERRELFVFDFDICRGEAELTAELFSLR